MKYWFKWPLFLTKDNNFIGQQLKNLGNQTVNLKLLWFQPNIFNLISTILRDKLIIRIVEF